MKNFLPKIQGKISFEALFLLFFILTMSAIGIVRIKKYLDEVKYQNANGEMAEFQAGLTLYKHDNGVYPDTLKDIEIYIRKEIRRDPWGNSYLYKTDKTSYTLTSLASDGREGGDGYWKDIEVSNK